VPLESDLIFGTCSSIATFVNSDDLIETARVNVHRYDHDPVTLASKGLEIEETRTNLYPNSINLSFLNVVTVRPSTHFLLFKNGSGGFTVREDGILGLKPVSQTTGVASPNHRTCSVFLRRGSNNFAQLVGQSDEHYFCDFDLANGIIGTKGIIILSAMI
jgi:hypothetical protein